MQPPSFANHWNTGALETIYEQFKADPNSVDKSWRTFFQGFELGAGKMPARADADCHDQVGIFRLIHAYRDLGHFIAHLDPLSDPKTTHSLLELSEFNLDESDLDREFDTSNIPHLPRATLRKLLSMLRKTYCRTIGVEYMHIQDTHIRQWLQERMEPQRNQAMLSGRQKIRLLMDLNYAEMFERFLHTKYIGQKRFSLEGGESLIPLLETLVETASTHGIEEIVIGMAHRGRLNVLANVLGKPYQEIFAEFQDNFLPESIDGDGDVKYHLGFSADRKTSHGDIHLTLTPNPSHLEAVNPVVEGRVRAKQSRKKDSERSQIIPLLIHGDAAFAGQGLVAETLNLSQLTGYKTGGTIHIIVNNQIGFTTVPSDGRSTYYCTDVAKMIQVPIFHFNGEDPEAAYFVAQLAMEFRQTFHMDVVLDMYCYRRHGHNESDDPSYTQPLMYSKIKDRPPLSEVYTEQLVARGDLAVDEVEDLKEEFESLLSQALEEVRSDPPEKLGMKGFKNVWEGLSPYYDDDPIDTTISKEVLHHISAKLHEIPEDFSVNPKIARQMQRRHEDFEEGQPIDWAFAEALAFGSLLLEGFPVRLSGQDSRRGTFSQRHSALYDAETGEIHFPLNSLSHDQAKFSVYNSLLSEAGVLGFEFGYSLDSPNNLIIWEAQFGDFVNGAQVIIDQFLVCSYSKWQRDSGLVLFLPHGYEGQGPEHSSARLERFLQQCGEENIQVGNLTTPAQYFHILRRQMKRNFRKPLILMTPKSLLRHKRVVSPHEDFTAGGFSEILDDPEAGSDKVERVLLCSGKVYYDLLEEKENKSSEKLAIIRVEQFYPLPRQMLLEILQRYSEAKQWIWVQEESYNMGAWNFMEPRLRELGFEFQYVGRDISASPATGSRQIHLREQKELVRVALWGKVPHMVRATHVLPEESVVSSS